MIQRKIDKYLADFYAKHKKDIAKYAPKNKLCLNEILDSIPPELNNQNKRFILKKRNGNVLPIEIKSGKDYKRHNVLKNVMETPNYEIKQVVFFCNDNIRAKSNVLYCPILDLSGLESRV